MDQEKGLLEPCRVLDLTDEKGIFCGQILGDLGADVIKVEKPGGDPARRIGPFLNEEVDPQKSLFWLAYSRNKRSITLNIETEDGRRLFERLVKTADIVIESFEPGYLDEIKLGYQELCQIKPSVILVSISPFGQSGPYSHYKGSDITMAAMSGYMFLCGDPAEPPLRITFPQSYLHASAGAVTGAVMALYSQRVTGVGQHVDVSAQASLLWATEMATMAWDTDQLLMRRKGNLYGTPPAPPRRCSFRCADGWVTCLLRAGKGAGASTRALVAWMEEEGGASDFMKTRDWENFDTASTPKEDANRAFDEIEQFFCRFSKKKIYEEAVKRGIVAYVVFTVADISDDAQLKAREYWMRMDYPEFQTSLTYPGFFAKISRPLRIQHRAPLIGEHNGDIYIGELGLSSEECAILKTRDVI